MGFQGSCKALGIEVVIRRTLDQEGEDTVHQASMRKWSSPKQLTDSAEVLQANLVCNNMISFTRPQAHLQTGLHIDPLCFLQQSNPQNLGHRSRLSPSRTQPRWGTGDPCCCMSIGRPRPVPEPQGPSEAQGLPCRSTSSCKAFQAL